MFGAKKLSESRTYQPKIVEVDAKEAACVTYNKNGTLDMTSARVERDYLKFGLLLRKLILFSHSLLVPTMSV